MAARETPRDRIPAFIARVRAIGRKDTGTLWGTCMAEKRVLKAFGQAITSLHRVFTDYRNAIRSELGATHPALRYMRLSLDDMEDRRGEYQASVFEAHNNLRGVDTDELVQKARAIVRDADDVNPMLLAGALLLLTGRRVVEVFKTGDFSRSRRRDALTFAGQAKRKGAAIAEPPYEIPVLAAPDVVLRAIAVLRRRCDCSELTNRGVNDRYSSLLNRRIAGVFRDHDKTALSPSDLRAVYATTAYATRAPKRLSPNAYFASILGHAPGDLITALSYLKFYPIGEKRAWSSDLRWSLETALVLQYEMLEDERDPSAREKISERIAQLEGELR